MMVSYKGMTYAFKSYKFSKIKNYKINFVVDVLLS